MIGKIPIEREVKANASMVDYGDGWWNSGMVVIMSDGNLIRLRFAFSRDVEKFLRKACERETSSFSSGGYLQFCVMFG